MNSYGVGFWNHRGSWLLSLLILLGALSLIAFDIWSFMVKLWARPNLVLELLLKVTFYVLIIISPLLSLISKLRSIFTTAAPNFAWATALNVRYLVKRAQVLDIGRRGLPGKPFLLLCTLGPLLSSFYRFMIFAYISDCGPTMPIVVTSVVGTLFTESFGLFMYMVYFLRLSFQRQFTLLTYYFKEHEGDYLRCNGALHALVGDYACFNVLCNLVAFIMYPVLVFAISANVTFEYLLTTSCVANDPISWNIEKNVSLLAWFEIGLVFFSYVMAIGGLQVEYLLNNFITNLLHLKSPEHRGFWKAVLGEIPFVAKESYVFLITVVLSFVSFFTAFKLNAQDISDLTDNCNGTHHTSLCV